MHTQLLAAAYLEWLLAGVNAQVLLEVVLELEGFGAFIALELPLRWVIPAGCRLTRAVGRALVVEQQT